MSDLCLDCGLCCTTLFFSAVPVSADELPDVPMQLKLERRSDKLTVFALPCVAHQNYRCTVYDQRPKVCRGYQCDLMLDETEGLVAPTLARQVVAEAKKRFEAVEKQLASLAPEATYLPARVTKVLKDALSDPAAGSAPRPVLEGRLRNRPAHAGILQEKKVPAGLQGRRGRGLPRPPPTESLLWARPTPRERDNRVRVHLAPTAQPGLRWRSLVVHAVDGDGHGHTPFERVVAAGGELDLVEHAAEGIDRLPAPLRPGDRGPRRRRVGSLEKRRRRRRSSQDQWRQGSLPAPPSGFENRKTRRATHQDDENGSPSW